ncbi:hypothetical protein CYMTET_14212, partial [Cymbomonas tetramitiformis]
AEITDCGDSISRGTYEKFSIQSATAKYVALLRGEGGGREALTVDLHHSQKGVNRTCSNVETAMAGVITTDCYNVGDMTCMGKYMRDSTVARKAFTNYQPPDTCGTYSWQRGSALLDGAGLLDTSLLESPRQRGSALLDGAGLLDTSLLESPRQRGSALLDGAGLLDTSLLESLASVAVPCWMVRGSWIPVSGESSPACSALLDGAGLLDTNLLESPRQRGSALLDSAGLLDTARHVA